MPISKKLERREAARENKALTAARLEKSLERELIARLKSRAYGDQPLNINEDVWRAVLNREREVEAEGELEALGLESDDETDEESGEENEEDENEFVSDLEESELGDLEDYQMDGGEVCVSCPPGDGGLTLRRSTTRRTRDLTSLLCKGAPTTTKRTRTRKTRRPWPRASERRWTPRARRSSPLRSRSRGRVRCPVDPTLHR